MAKAKPTPDQPERPRNTNPHAADFMREVEEDLHAERLKFLWNRYGNYLLGAVIAIVVVTLAYSIQSSFTKSALEEAGDQLLTAQQHIDNQKPENAVVILQDLVKNAPETYQTLAAFKLLNLRGEHPELNISVPESVSVPPYDALYSIAKAAQTTGRATLSLTEDALNDVTTLARSNTIWRYPAIEVLAFRAWEEGQIDQAKTHFTTLAEDAGTPSFLKERSQQMLEVIGQ